MADAPYIQGKIYYGYGKAAEHLGLPYTFYHALSPINPIVAANVIGIIKVSLNQNWAYMKANRYGNAVWQMVADARQPPDSIGFTMGDYFLGESLEPQNNFVLNEEGGFTLQEDSSQIRTETKKNLAYFVISKQLILPILAVECNRTVTIQRADQSNDPDSDVYSGYTPGTALTLASEMPVSILVKAIGRKNEEKLVTDTLMPRLELLMPNLGNITFKNKDILIDDLGHRYVLASAEKTDFGWRCGIQLLGA